MSYSDFFVDIAEQEYTSVPILLVDASGSVKNTFTTGTVFDKMLEICKSINSNRFRVIFWNSDNEKKTINTSANLFVSGILKLSHVVQKESLGQPFTLASKMIENNCLTYPHLAFDAIPNEWIDNTKPTHIYFITDGQMGYNLIPSYEMQSLKNNLKKSIETIFKKFNNIHLHIVTIESKSYDFNSVESLGIMAGGDFYDVIKTNGLTKYVTEFVSYALNHPNGFKHINSIIPPAGFIPYGGKCFSEANIGKFIRYLNTTVREFSQNETELLKIIQYLSSSIRYIIKDKSNQMAMQIIKTFCNIFAGTVLDSSIVEMMLSDTIKRENEGKAIVFSEYRAKLKNLYKEAQTMIINNTKNATGINERFISLPIAGKIVVGNGRIVTENINMQKTNYICSSVKMKDFVFPVLPLITSNPGLMSGQCIRQFVRSIVGTQYRVNSMDDIVIYIVLGEMLRIVCSNVSDEYKNAYRKLATVMLMKKRLNSEQTEIERLENGDLPIPNNGNMDTFYSYMTRVSTIAGIKPTILPLTVWYCICVALDNESIITKQLIHCREDITRNFSSVIPSNILSHIICDPVSIVEIPEEAMLDYNCVVTLDNTSTTGGYRIKQHESITGSQCSPYFVMSLNGYNEMITQPNVFCPICYSTLTNDNFEEVGPKITFEEDVFNDVQNPFIPVATKLMNTPLANKMAELTISSSASSTSNTTVVFLKGTVGSGKTTISKLIKKKVEELGGACIVEGTDNYCKNGTLMKDAISMVSNNLKQFDYVNNPRKVVVIDTCGENCNKSCVFGQNYSSCKIIYCEPNFNSSKIDGYMAWTLRNVLNRSASGLDTDYWLNPSGAGLSTCINVHNKKAKTVIKKQFQNENYYRLSKENILAKINDTANEYDTYLAQNMPLDDQVTKLISKIM